MDAHHHTSHCLYASQSGAALLLVLWIITLFAVICAEFSWTMRTETTTAANFREGEQAYYAAEAGINRAVLELLRTANAAVRIRKSAEDETEEAEPEYWLPGGGPFVEAFAGCTFEVTIEDENNKIGINKYLQKKTNIITLKQLLQRKIGLEGEERDIVADSLMDWYDGDHNITGINGAEDDYYKSLDPPYECRDGDIPVLDELLLVRGVTEEIFYGRVGPPEHKVRLTADELEQLLQGSPDEAAGDEEEEISGPAQDNETAGGAAQRLGLVHIFSVHSQAQDLKPNINTAALEQLLWVEGIDEDTAREILEARQERVFASVTDRLPQFANYEVWKNRIEVKNPTSRGALGRYTVTSRGISSSGRITRSITCAMVVTRSRCIITHWKEVDL